MTNETVIMSYVKDDVIRGQMTSSHGRVKQGGRGGGGGCLKDGDGKERAGVEGGGVGWGLSETTCCSCALFSGRVMSVRPSSIFCRQMRPSSLPPLSFPPLSVSPSLSPLLTPLPGGLPYTLWRTSRHPLADFRAPIGGLPCTLWRTSTHPLVEIHAPFGGLPCQQPEVSASGPYLFVSRVQSTCAQVLACPGGFGQESGK